MPFDPFTCPLALSIRLSPPFVPQGNNSQSADAQGVRASEICLALLAAYLLGLTQCDQDSILQQRLRASTALLYDMLPAHVSKTRGSDTTATKYD